MDYSTVTEVPGNLITRDALRMVCTRYEHGSRLSEGKQVLEVGCGAGLGLGHLGRRAARVVGGDCTRRLLRLARDHYGSSRPLVQLDAQALPFADGTFDVVLLYEAIYYLGEPSRFVAECKRVLRRGGLVLICSANRERPDFHPSPFSRRYLSAAEIHDLLQSHGYAVELFSAFPVERDSFKDAAVGVLKRAAVKLNAIPRTMKGKTLLKRLFLGKLVKVPPEVTPGMARIEELRRIGRGEAPVERVLYAIGRLN